MIPELAEGIGPVTVLDPLAGAITHLATQFWIPTNALIAAVLLQSSSMITES